MFDLLFRVALGTAVLYLMFWVLWFRKHIDTFKYLLHGRDKKWVPIDTSAALATRGTPTKIKLYFVRHGESTWNVVFNGSKAPHFFIGRLLHSAFSELVLIFKGVRDSWFYDAPLSELGIEQAKSIQSFLASKKDDPAVATLLGRSGVRSLLVTSNLRRAISTGLIGFVDRIKDKGDKFIVLPSLQEISNNPDALSITPPGLIPRLSWIEEPLQWVDMRALYEKSLDVSQNTGNKPVSSNGLIRMLQFNEWAFQQNCEVIIVVGHSLWFRSFFREFLPRTVKHEAKDNKLSNGAVVELEVARCEDNNGNPTYRIPAESVRLVHGAFKSG